MVKKGYKQTEIGVLPEDWSVLAIGDIASFQGGSQPPIQFFTSQEQEGYIRLVQIRDYKTDKYITYIPVGMAKRFCLKDDIMIGRYGPPVFQILRGIEGAYNVALIKAVPKDVDKDFLYYTLKAESLFEYIDLLSRRSSGQTGVDLDGLREYKIGLPAMSEQKKIADALLSLDDLITTIEKQISKKKAIKQGAMQELLTGKRRLPGFEGEWQTIPLKKALTVCHGMSQHEVESSAGRYPILATGGIIGRANRYLWNAPSVLIGRKGTINKPQYMDKPFWSIDTLFYTKINEGYCPKFLYYVFCLIDWLSYNEASGVPSLSAKTIEGVEVQVPDYVEQCAIANTLSEMDTEIEALEQKLEKYRQVKRGMMQQLLTGKIRLV